MSWDDVDKILHHTFYNELRTAPEEQPLIFVVPPTAKKISIEKYTQIFFENFNVPVLLPISQATCTLMSAGKHTGISVILGENSTWVVPVYCHHRLDWAASRNGIGGNQITEHLLSVLNEQGSDTSDFATTAGREVLRDIKEKNVYVALDFDKEMVLPTSVERGYELQAGDLYTIEAGRFKAAECIFQPNLYPPTEGQVPLHKLILQSYFKIKSSSVKLANYMMNNIVLSGGTSMFEGLVKRLEKELRNELPDNVPIRIIASADRKYGSWTGASILGSLTLPVSAYITKEEYDEEGPSVIHKKYLYTRTLR
eukprot:TRINITY_DN3183_c0_g1_i2.p1 TRINITY_DN3183_c0_g1~~TRINITY_DN3183_c0_g1_i2.p1  ORF type:complete len:311 (-),score=50.25 TRINITY_DN3183_c0_g1_i2:4-936(-)